MPWQFDAAAEAYNDLEQELVTRSRMRTKILYNTLALSGRLPDGRGRRPAED